MPSITKILAFIKVISSVPQTIMMLVINVSVVNDFQFRSVNDKFACQCGLT